MHGMPFSIALSINIRRNETVGKDSRCQIDIGKTLGSLRLPLALALRGFTPEQLNRAE